MIRVICILFLFHLFGIVPGQSLDDHLIFAAKNNPGLKSKFFEYQAALERIPQVGALSDPQLGFSIFIMPMERYMGNQVGSVSIMQMFPWFGTLGAAKNEMSFMAKAKFEEFNEAKSNLFYEIRETWYATYLIEKEIEITKESVELLNTVLEISIVGFKSGGQGNAKGTINNNLSTTSAGASVLSGKMDGMAMDQKSLSNNIGGKMGQMSEMSNMVPAGSLIDVLRIQMEMNELKNNLLLLEDTKIALITRFNKLLNRKENEPVFFNDTILAPKLPVPLSVLPDSIKKGNPMILMLEKEEAAFITKGNMNRKMGMPMIGLGLQYDIFKHRENNLSKMNGRNMVMPMVTVSIPLWRKKYSALVRESDLLRQSVVEERQEVSNLLMVNYEEVIRDFNDAERRIGLYKEQASLANRAMNILITNYSTDSEKFDEVIRMQQKLLGYKLKYLDGIIDSNIAVAMMNKLMGR